MSGPTADAIEVRVYYEDTDLSGFVYHANYLKFFERGRSEFLRRLGLTHGPLREKGQVFAVREMHIAFDAPAMIDDLLRVETAPGKASGARMVLRQTIRRGEAVLCRAEVTVVMMGMDGRPARLPHALRAMADGAKGEN